MIRAWFFSLFVMVVLTVPYWVRGAAADEAFRQPDDAPMAFFEAFNGGNCNICEWIIADGVIEKGTASRFEKFLSNSDGDFTGARVEINSTGGNLFEALKLGEVFRKHKMNLVVGKTLGVIQDWKTRGNRTVYQEAGEAGQCASACVYAFAGGWKRFTDEETRLGVHQFFDPDSLAEPEKKVATGFDRSLDQVVTGVLVAYLAEMGVDTRLLSIAGSRTPWSGMHWLTRDQILHLNLDNTTDRYSSIALVPFGRDGAVVEVKHVAGAEADLEYPTIYRLYCRGKSRSPHISILFRSETDVRDAYDDIARNIDFRFILPSGARHVRADPVAYKVEKLDDGQYLNAMSWVLPDADKSWLVGARRIEYEQDPDGNLPRVYWAASQILKFDLVGDPRITKIALSHCIK